MRAKRAGVISKTVSMVNWVVELMLDVSFVGETFWAEAGCTARMETHVAIEARRRLV